ncbi:transcription termination/antitermination protein NusG [Edaphobacter bradus]|uniref:transcription termination/antitermination protein NusG n=1 Tax=Edaphobacter bradus TaxID=2259016 RepID=UPI0021DFDC8C|nr:UpxY family transcription antiterminator [Edaphobacter bradus]
METTHLVENDLRPRWYAAYTVPRHEKAVAHRLASQKVESYLPLYSSVRHWNHRRVEVQLPLFPGYVFVRMLLSDRVRVLSRPGIIRLVSFDGGPAVLPDEEIERLQSSLSTWKAKPYPYLTAGKHVRITSGPFAGLEGKILQRKGKMRLLVTLDLIQSAMLLEMDAAEAQLAS